MTILRMSSSAPKTALQAQKVIRKHKNNQKKVILQRFFKTGPGEYGEGDVFLGITVPIIRSCAKECLSLPLPEALTLLHSRYHEERLCALIILVAQYRTGDATLKKNIYTAYLSHTKYINNWDLIDLTAEHIVGAYLKEVSQKPLFRLASSSSLWERRIAIIATFHYIKSNQFKTTLDIADKLLTDSEDLIHKAAGWMLREVGKRDLQAEETFLKSRYRTMPRTMLRYAIEKFPEKKRQDYLKGRVRS